MIILHYSREPYTAAMLEAALIEKFQSNSVLIGGCFLFLAILGAPRFRHIFLQPSNQTKADKDVRMSEQAVTQSTQKSQLQTADLWRILCTDPSRFPRQSQKNDVAKIRGDWYNKTQLLQKNNCI